MKNQYKYTILQNKVQGKIDGRWGPGRQRISWMGNLRKWFRMTFTELFLIITNKIRMAMMISNVGNRLGHRRRTWLYNLLFLFLYSDG